MAAPVFSFGLITDTHVRPAGGDQSSPYKVNDLANDRARYACQLLAAHSPAFTIHIGDMVHPLPHLPTYSDACTEAHEIFEPLKPNLHFVPGNHDIGDKPMDASPAGPVDEESEAIYREHFGPSWYLFEHDGCAFIVINSSLVNSGHALETEQRNWLEEVLENNKKKRIFLCSHYPPMINAADESPHYDNYDQPGRNWLLGLLERHNVEAVFSGHVHQFFYNRHGTTKLYCLPPTSFTRQDYSELYRGVPQAEFGRDDRGKFSIALVHVHAKGHSLQIIPTDGTRCKAGDVVDSEPKQVTKKPNIIVNLRHAWYEAIDLPFNGPMEEFSRKRARNDYPLLRLWQMGIENVRTPLEDFIDPAVMALANDWAATGIKFNLITTLLPDAVRSEKLKKNAELIDTLEFATRIDTVPNLVGQLPSLAAEIEVPFTLTKIHTSADEKREGSKFAHTVSSGFLAHEADQVLKLLGKECSFFSIVYQLNWNDDMETIVSDLLAKHENSSTKPAFNVRFGLQDPSKSNFHDRLIANRMDKVLELAEEHQDIKFQIDTLMDIDRGYSPRSGLLDRSSNFRAMGLKIVEFAAKSRD